MKKTQTKDTIAKMILSLVMLFLGEGLFSFGLYWPVIMSLGLVSKRGYWYGFVFGILVSAVTRSILGLASLLIVSSLFLFGRLRERVRENVGLIGLVAVGFNLIADKVMGLSWSVFEGVAVFLLALIFFRLDFFNDDLHLSNR
ncbi:hypothetical protein HYU91_00350 [Candidatus Collierbacteria bacterium]|nr:hypothetical protein [Candidatus Collierbacteria bacterium]